MTIFSIWHGVYNYPLHKIVNNSLLIFFFPAQERFRAFHLRPRPLRRGLMLWKD